MGLKIDTKGAGAFRPGMEEFATSFRTKYTASGITLSIP